MHESITASTWKKMFLVMFLSASILLTVSYYDHAKILKYQVVLRRNISRLNVSTEINRTESKFLINKICFSSNLLINCRFHHYNST